MNMSKKIIKVLTSVAFALLSVLPSMAQDGAAGAYSPYSVFGIGDLYRQGNAYGKTMGGTGIAGRDRRYINLLNPASVTARDTLSVMFDMGLYLDNRVFRQNDLRSVNNTFNINNFSVSFPIKGKTAMMFSLSPYSNVGYDYSYSMNAPVLIAQTGYVNYNATGTGSIYQLSGAIGTQLFKRLSIGVEGIYYFGNLDKDCVMSTASTSHRALQNGYTLQLNAFAGKIGVQYEQPVGGLNMTIGATYKTSARLKGYVTDYKYASISGLVDTLYHKVDTLSKGPGVKMAGEIGVGVSIRRSDRWSAEINYTYSDWTGSGMGTYTGFANNGKSNFSTTYSQNLRAGFEIIPNRNDIRYYMRTCSYRGGLYYERAYYKLDGNTVNSYGITLGMTFPVFRFYNGITVGMDLGQRGSTRGNMTKENYIRFSLGINIHDLWFIKPRYE